MNPRPVRLFLVALLAFTFQTADAQSYRREGNYPPRVPPPGLFDRGVTFCRLMYYSDRGEPSGRGWSTDYPYAEINFMSRIAELTTTAVNFEGDVPNTYVVRPLDDALFGCPFLMASDVGTARFTPEEGARLRAYFAKGGFLWVDDFWGEWAWAQWTEEIQKILPRPEYTMADVPISDAMLATLYEMDHIPQITNIRFWRQSGGRTTSERGAETATPHLRAIRDAKGRILVLMSHNTDVGDSWERETEDIEFFYKFAHDGYALGINVFVHAMSH